LLVGMPPGCTISTRSLYTPLFLPLSRKEAGEGSIESRPSGINLGQHVGCDLQAIRYPVGGVKEVDHRHDLYHSSVVQSQPLDRGCM
jgi:hypothetical protein